MSTKEGIVQKTSTEKNLPSNTRLTFSQVIELLHFGMIPEEIDWEPQTHKQELPLSDRPSQFEDDLWLQFREKTEELLVREVALKCAEGVLAKMNVHEHLMADGGINFRYMINDGNGGTQIANRPMLQKRVELRQLQLEQTQQDANQLQVRKELRLKHDYQEQEDLKMLSQLLECMERMQQPEEEKIAASQVLQQAQQQHKLLRQQSEKELINFMKNFLAKEESSLEISRLQRSLGFKKQSDPNWQENQEQEVLRNMEYRLEKEIDTILMRDKTTNKTEKQKVSIEADDNEDSQDVYINASPLQALESPVSAYPIDDSQALIPEAWQQATITEPSRSLDHPI